MSGKRPTSAPSLRSLPTRWAVGIIGVLIAYGLLQPVINKQLGWQLPSLASLQQPKNGDTPTRPVPSPSTDSASESASDSASDLLPSESGRQSEPLPPAPAPVSGPDSSDGIGPATAKSSNTSLRYGILRETSTDDYLSPAGLRYTRGSAEGHRLKHIERHLADDPNRPGKHGVFDGDMPQVMRWIDEAYELAKRGARGTKKSEEDGRIVYEASFSKPIGFVGGRDGRRDNNPDARRLRLVVDGNKVITAFPF
jgi:hypothetical protein